MTCKASGKSANPSPPPAITTASITITNNRPFCHPFILRQHLSFYYYLCCLMLFEILELLPENSNPSLWLVGWKVVFFTCFVSLRCSPTYLYAFTLVLVTFIVIGALKYQKNCCQSYHHVRNVFKLHEVDLVNKIAKKTCLYM